MVGNGVMVGGPDGIVCSILFVGLDYFNDCI